MLAPPIALVLRLLLGVTDACCVSSGLVGRSKEGGRAVLRNKRAMAHSIISSVRATPTQPRPTRGAGALTPSVLPMQTALAQLPRGMREDRVDLAGVG